VKEQGVLGQPATAPSAQAALRKTRSGKTRVQIGPPATHLMRRAIDILVKEGLVQTAPSRGTFVTR
jgi:hypothetical protein